MNSPNTRPKGRRFSSGLPTHLKIDPANHAYRSSSKPAYATSSEGSRRRRWFSAAELASSVLISLSYTLTSVTHEVSSLSRRSNIDVGANALEGQMPQKNTAPHQMPLKIGPDILATCALTSGVLLLVAGNAKLRDWIDGEPDVKPSVMGHRRTGSIQTEVITVDGARKMLSNSFSVGLPIYASFQLGGVQTCLIILIAIVADLMGLDDHSNSTNKASWKRLWKSRRWTIAALLFQVICDMAFFSSITGPIGRFSGFLALCVSVFVLPPPLPVHTSKKHHLTSPTAPPPSTGSNVLTTLKETPASSSTTLPDRKVSALTRDADDVNLTLVAGFAVGFLTIATFLLSSIPSAGAFSTPVVVSGVLTSCVAALSLIYSQPQSLLQSRGLGALLGSLLSCFLLTSVGHLPRINFVFQGAFILLCSAATIKDTHSSHSSSHHSHDHKNGHSHHDHANHTEHHEEPSRVSKYLLDYAQKWPLLHSILSEKDSRRIFYFMILNFAFMLVQTFYGIATGSLGLLSDSIHMFFDCLALVVGLCAAVMSKWSPSTRFPYGFGKMDTLAGFANGIFLMLISVEIVYEAIERLAEGSEMQRIGELLTVSSLGLIVNLVGMTAFGHAHHGHGHSHGHSHGGDDHSHDHGHTPTSHDHSHDHGHTPTSHDHTAHAHDNKCHDHHGHENHDKHDHTHLHDHLHASPYSSVPATPSKPPHAHSHAHGHHHHGNDNMHGIFLHILADTMGSVAVIISTLLIHFYKWSGFDPIASVIIAVLIFASAVPLVKSSATTLLLTIPEDTEYDLRDALAGVSALRGVVGYAVPKFWLDEGEERKVLGVIHVFAGKNADMEDVKERAVAYLKTRGMNVLVQVEREGSGRCWCRGGLRSS